MSSRNRVAVQLYILSVLWMIFSLHDNLHGFTIVAMLVWVAAAYVHTDD